MNREKKIKQQRRRRIIFYVCVFAICLCIGYAMGEVTGEKVNNVGSEEITETEQAEKTAFIIGENQPEKTLKSLGTYTITAYCPCKKCCGKWANGITASGVYAKANHTIAAPKNIPFGTVLVIDGVPYTVEDRGGAIKNKRLDIFFSDHKSALRYGKQKHEVFVYE